MRWYFAAAACLPALSVASADLIPVYRSSYVNAGYPDTFQGIGPQDSATASTESFEPFNQSFSFS